MNSFKKGKYMIRAWKFKNRVITYDQWIKEGEERFGKSKREWKFVCCMCGTSQSFNDFLEHTDLTEDEIQRVITFSCIGRQTEGASNMGEADKGKIGCNWSLGGLLQAHTLSIIPPEGEVDKKGEPLENRPSFDFWEEPVKATSKIDSNRCQNFDTRDQRSWKIERLNTSTFKVIEVIDGNEFLKNNVGSDCHRGALNRYLINESKEDKNKT